MVPKDTPKLPPTSPPGAGTAEPPLAEPRAGGEPLAPGARGSAVPWAPLALAAALAALAFLPTVREHPVLVGTLAGAAGLLGLWSAVLGLAAKRAGRALAAAFTPVRAHWVQACVQGCVFLYWGLYWTEIRQHAPMILAQVLFLYAFEALLAWSRGRVWRVGFGPLPVIFSTNLLLWFKYEWFFLQFAMVAIGALGKEFLRWQRDGQRTHIFNPSVFGQSTMAIALIATGTTSALTWGPQLAVAFESLEHAYWLLFALGLLVQRFFGVTLMTLSATAMLALLNVIYTEVTGTYFFVSVNIGATVFLGMHLLVTDPSTSPRTNVGRVIYGAGYALGYFVLYRVFEDLGVPSFWDKLLPVPILNLLVPVFDRISRSGPLANLNRRWEAFAPPRSLNLVHMAVWAVLFVGMILTGFLGHDHPGKSVDFWVDAFRDGRHRAGQVLRSNLEYGARLGNADYANRLGAFHLSGELVEQDDARAAHYFAQACDGGHTIGCENLVALYLFRGKAVSMPHVERALTHLEALPSEQRGPQGTYLIGYAYAAGLGRPQDPERGLALFQQACEAGHLEACQAADALRRELMLQRARSR